MGRTTRRRHDEALAQLEAASLHVGVGRALVEEQVLELLDLLVEALHGSEVPVDDGVDQAVEQEPDAAAGEIGGAVPPGDHVVHVEGVVLAHGDERGRGDERRELAELELRRVVIESHGVDVEELVGAVAVQLGSLPGGEGVGDGEAVQAELVGDHGEVIGIGRAQVHPYDDVVLADVLGHVLDGEVLALEDAARGTGEYARSSRWAVTECTMPCRVAPMLRKCGPRRRAGAGGWPCPCSSWRDSCWFPTGGRARCR